MSPAGKRGCQRLFLVALLLFFPASGCLVGKGKYDEALEKASSCCKNEKQLRVTNEWLQEEKSSLRERAEALENENRTLLEDMAALAAEQEELARKSAQYKKQMEERQQKVERVTDTYRNLVERLSPEIDQGKIRIDQADTRLKLNLVDKILFPSGSATLTEKGKQILEKVGYALKETKDRKIMIEGHTDDLPLSPNLKKRFPSNWDLSALRATAVVRHLQENVGIDPRLLSATGYSKYTPIVENNSSENRRMNRRIEIVLVPLNPKEMQRLYMTKEAPLSKPKATPASPESPPVVIPILP